MSNSVLSTGVQRVQLTPGVATWTREYPRRTVISDFTVAVICSTVALLVRFERDLGIEYVLCGVIVPLLWVATLSLFRVCNARREDTGAEDFGKALCAGSACSRGSRSSRARAGRSRSRCCRAANPVVPPPLPAVSDTRVGRVGGAV
jgi:hypothetical protein